MTWGGKPEKKEAPPPKVKQRRTPWGDTGYLMFYFVHHTKAGMDQLVTQEERMALAECFKKMRAIRGMGVEEITKTIDAFYASEVGSWRRPALVYVAQNSVKNAIPWGQLAPGSREFVAMGFERTDDMHLPWGGEYDKEIKRRVLYDPDNLLDIIGEYE